MDKTWKAFERYWSKRWGGKRVPVHGTLGLTCDIEHPLYWIECKYRSSKPQWLLDWVNQSVNGCPENKLPLVLFHCKGINHNEDLVIIKAKEFEDWFINKQSEKEK